MEVGLGQSDFVLDGDPASPPKKREQSLNFRPMCVVAERLDGLIFNMPLGMEVGLGPGDFMLDGNPNKKGDTAPQFSAQIYCGQTARWIKMPLGSEVGLGPCDIVLDGIEIHQQKGGTAPSFRPMSILAKRLDASGYHLVRR